MAAHRISHLARLLAAGVLAVGAAMAVPGTAQAAGSWHAAVPVPGLASLSGGGPSNFGTISCASAGNCSAGGNYTDSGGHVLAFVADEVNGSWHNAKEVAGNLNTTLGSVASISCFSAGNCSAGGVFANAPYIPHAFVIDRVSGAWHTAREAPGTPALSGGQGASVESVSCRTGANCSAVGNYNDSPSTQQVFVLDRVSGSWGQAKEIPGTASLNADGNAFSTSVSCGSAGNCSVGGEYLDGSAHYQVFVANRQNGTWHDAVELPGLGGLNTGGNASLSALSCGAALNCSAVGTYVDGSGVTQSFVANRVNGTWHTAFQAPGTAALSGGHTVRLFALSCPSAGNCTAGGDYSDGSGHFPAFVMREVNGHWGGAIAVPGLAALDLGSSSQIDAVSCAAAGACTAGGYFSDSAHHEQAFVVDQVNGVWGNAQEVPGTGALNVDGNARVVSLSCSSASACSGGGTYVDAGGRLQAFVVRKS